MTHELKTAISAAEALLAHRQAIAAALQTVEQELPVTLARRVQLESELAEIEADAVLSGKPDPKKLDAARKAVSEARESADGAIARRIGLHRRAERQASELAAAAEAINAQLPSHREATVKTFLETQWLPAIQAFSRVLAARQQLEAVLGGPFQLPEPNRANNNAEPVEVGDLAKPGLVLAELRGAVAWINGQRQAVEVAKRRGRHAPLDSSRVYMLRKEWNGLKAGHYVTLALLGESAQFLHENGYLMALRDNPSTLSESA